MNIVAMYVFKYLILTLMKETDLVSETLLFDSTMMGLFKREHFVTE